MRVCERGITGCVADHKAATEPLGAVINNIERTELLDWASACQSAYHIDNTPGHRFAMCGSNLQENREGLVEFVERLVSQYASVDLMWLNGNQARTIDSLSADAARYRHLVATCNVAYDPSEPWQLVISEPSTGEDWKAKLDAAIDAAMGAKNGGAA